MIKKFNFFTDEDNREPIPASKDFPFVVKYTEFSPGEIATWHWHDFFEFTVPLHDGMTLQTSNQTLTLNRGDAAFVNISMLHTASWNNTPETKACYTIFFDKSVLTGEYGSIFEEKYVNPLVMCRDLDCCAIRPQNRRGLKMMTLLDEIVSYFEKEDFGYELKSRSALSELWLMLLEETEELRKNSGKIDPTDTQRMKQMMNFVHDHFRDKIYLDEIASSAGISPRECLRCFKKQIGSTPMEYLNRYRVRMAANELMTSATPISIIGEECGFASDSYFGKIFRQYMNCTPREYRKKMQSDEFNKRNDQFENI